MTGNGYAQLALYIAVLLLLAKPLGAYMARVYEGQPALLNRIGAPLENLIYRLCGTDPAREMHWIQYALAMLWFNLLGLLAVYALQRFQAVLPIMIRQGGARIVNLGSLAGKEGLAGIAAYSAASAGVITFTKALSREVAQHNVFVNCVAPGPIDTDMIQDLGAEVVSRWISDSPMGRLGKASEVAHLVAWLCTEASSFNTGAVFDMSGGRARY